MTAIISVDELWHLRHSGAKLDIVDVRSETEFAAAHIRGAKCIPLQQLPHRHADLGDGDLVLVCEAGTRASIALKSLSQRSGRVFALDGGTRAWREAGLPLIAVRGTQWSLERQVRLGAGVMILIGITLALLVSEMWIVAPTLVGAGLTFAGADRHLYDGQAAGAHALEPVPLRQIVQSLGHGGTQESALRGTIIADLRKNGFEPVSAVKPDLMANDPTRILVRQMIAAVPQYERSQIG